MVELVYTTDLKSVSSNAISVRVRAWAPFFEENMIKVTLDNGEVIMYENFQGIQVNTNDEVTAIIIKGSVTRSQEYTQEIKNCINLAYPEDGPLAIRTIEFLS